MRLFYGAKSLYSIDFYKSYSEFINPIILSSLGKMKKALIFDCDNTLWHGILGEDGYKNIKMGDDSYEGRIFQQIQEKALELYNKGIFICLCTKNNYDDVIEVINKHKDMRLKKENFSVIKSNWKNKVDNIIEIAKELNVGLDSLVFIDDSDFELEFVKQKLPEVRLFKVPKDISKYYYLFNKEIQFFYKFNQTQEDKIRNIDFKNQLERKKLRTKFTKIEDYLNSLNIKITINLNDKKNLSRISQMTLKTNQFNLTTRRYSEKQIKNFLANKKYLIFTLSLKDKFGDSGITGLAILKMEKPNNSSVIDTFLLSCRIIGRNVEYAFMNFIISYLKKKNINLVRSNYIRSKKNDQVKNFYEQCSFEIEKNKKEKKKYSVKINKYKPKLLKYIKINE
jgi:FkbH-like protein